MWNKIARRMKKRIKEGKSVRFGLHFNFKKGKIELAEDKGRDVHKADPGRRKG